MARKGLAARYELLDREDLGLFGMDQPVDLGDDAVGEFLHFILRAALLLKTGRDMA